MTKLRVSYPRFRLKEMESFVEPLSYFNMSQSKIAQAYSNW